MVTAAELPQPELRIYFGPDDGYDDDDACDARVCVDLADLPADLQTLQVCDACASDMQSAARICCATLAQSVLIRTVRIATAPTVV